METNGQKRARDFSRSKMSRTVSSDQARLLPLGRASLLPIKKYSIKRRNCDSTDTVEVTLLRAKVVPIRYDIRYAFLWLDIGSRRYEPRCSTSLLSPRARYQAEQRFFLRFRERERKERRKEKRLTIWSERPSYQIGCTDDVWIELRDDKNGRFDAVENIHGGLMFHFAPAFSFFFFFFLLSFDRDRN